MQLAATRHRAGQHDEAAAIYEAVLQDLPAHPDALHLLGLIDAERGRVQEAVQRIQRAIAASPATEMYHLNLISICKAAGDFAAAEKVARNALASLPQSSKILSQRAVLEERRGALEEAEATRLQAIQLAPRNPALYGELAYMLELQNRLEEARQWATRGLQVDRQCDVCRLVLAKSLRRTGEVSKAISLLACRSQLDDSAYQFELGTLCDATGRHSAAFRHWERGNEIAVATHGSAVEPDRMLNEVVALQQLYQDSLVQQFTPLQIPETQTRLFVSGFPRSGTSLLHHRLAQMAGVVGCHEPRTIDSLKSAMKQLVRGYPATIATMTPDEAKLLIAVYNQVFAAISAKARRDPSQPAEHPEGDSAPPESYRQPESHQQPESDQQRAQRLASCCWLDTNPQHLIDLGLILRLFPDARFLYIVRHPMDVVLSCFMQNFRLSDYTANFTTIEGTVEAYHQIMTLWRQAMQQFPHNCRIIRYEALVESPEETLEEIQRWVGQEDIASSHEGFGHGTPQIATPSYHQVVRPMYRSAIGRWRNYTNQLATARKFLRPWLDYFGYSD